MPDFTHQSAQAIFDRLAPKPAPESPRVQAFRQARVRATTDAGATAIFDDFVRRVDPEEIDAILAANMQIESEAARAAEEALAAEIRDALGPQRAAEQAAAAATPDPTRWQPYVDDDGELRSSDGRVLDAEQAADALRGMDQNTADDLLGRLDAPVYDQVTAALGGPAQE
jgi:hypothetical protein